MSVALLTQREYELFFRNDGPTIATIKKRMLFPSERGTKLAGRKIKPLTNSLYVLYCTGKMNIFKEIPVGDGLTVEYFRLSEGKLQVKFEELDELLPWENECFDLPKVKVKKFSSPHIVYAEEKTRRPT